MFNSLAYLNCETLANFTHVVIATVSIRTKLLHDLLSEICWPLRLPIGLLGEAYEAEGKSLLLGIKGGSQASSA